MTSTMRLRMLRSAAAGLLVILPAAGAGAVTAGAMATAATTPCAAVEDTSSLLDRAQISTLELAARRPDRVPVVVRVEGGLGQAGPSAQSTADAVARHCFAASSGVVVLVRVDDGSVVSSSSSDLTGALFDAWPKVLTTTASTATAGRPFDLVQQVTGVVTDLVEPSGLAAQSWSAARATPAPVAASVAGGLAGGGALVAICVIRSLRRRRWRTKVDTIDTAALRRDQVNLAVAELEAVYRNVAWQGRKDSWVRMHLMTGAAALGPLMDLASEGSTAASAAAQDILRPVHDLLGALSRVDRESADAAAAVVARVAEPWLAGARSRQ